MADADAARAFLESGGAKLPARDSFPILRTSLSGVDRKRKRRKGIRQVSEKRAENLRTWAAIKQRKIQEQRDERGKTWCEVCGAESPVRLDLDHIVPAGRGGPWTYENAQLICSGEGSCHEAKHGKPWPS